MRQSELLANIRGAQAQTEESNKNKHTIGKYTFELQQEWFFDVIMPSQAYGSQDAFPFMCMPKRIEPLRLSPSTINQSDDTTIYTFKMTKEQAQKHHGAKVRLTTGLTIHFDKEKSPSQTVSNSKLGSESMSGLIPISDIQKAEIAREFIYKNLQFLATNVKSQLILRDKPTCFKNRFVAEFKNWNTPLSLSDPSLSLSDMFDQYVLNSRANEGCYSLAPNFSHGSKRERIYKAEAIACPETIENLQTHTEQECQDTINQIKSSTLPPAEKAKTIAAIKRMQVKNTLFTIRFDGTLLGPTEEVLKVKNKDIDAIYAERTAPVYRSLSIGDSQHKLVPVNSNQNKQQGCYTSATEKTIPTVKFKEANMMTNKLSTNKFVFKLMVFDEVAKAKTGIEYAPKIAGNSHS
jgi:hypothetical protein